MGNQKLRNISNGNLHTTKIHCWTWLIWNKQLRHWNYFWGIAKPAIAITRTFPRRWHYCFNWHNEKNRQQRGNSFTRSSELCCYLGRSSKVHEMIPDEKKIGWNTSLACTQNCTGICQMVVSLSSRPIYSVPKNLNVLCPLIPSILKTGLNSISKNWILIITITNLFALSHSQQEQKRKLNGKTYSFYLPTFFGRDGNLNIHRNVSTPWNKLLCLRKFDARRLVVFGREKLLHCFGAQPVFWKGRN